jgi:hypothetical protein
LRSTTAVTQSTTAFAGIFVVVKEGSGPFRAQKLVALASAGTKAIDFALRSA